MCPREAGDNGGNFGLLWCHTGANIAVSASRPPRAIEQAVNREAPPTSWLMA